MNILFLVRKFYPDIGGVEKHVFEISKRLTTLGHKVTIISEGKMSKDILNFEKFFRIKVIKIDAGKNEKKKKFIIWKWFWKNRNLINEADLIHCHDVFYWYLPFRFLYFKKPIFTTFHGYEEYPVRKSAVLVRKISEKLSWGNICIGDFIKKWYGTKPSFISYGAVDIVKGKDQKTEGNKKSAVFIGRLDEQTGILTYAKAVKAIKKKYSEFKFLIVGDGKYRKIVSKTGKVIGWQKNPEKYFKNYRFAFVSRYLSILEAFAAKKLVFAVYDNAIKRDYLKMAPFAKLMIIENNAENLAARVEEFLNSPQKEKKMVDNAYAWVKKQTWEGMVNLYLKLWKVK